MKSHEETKEALLRAALSAAVPFWIEEVRKYEPSVLAARKEECLKIICEKGDRILYKSEKAGETAEAFNRLAEAVAICSFALGGVKIFGLHFEAEPHRPPKRLNPNPDTERVGFVSETRPRPPRLEDVVAPGDACSGEALPHAIRGALPGPEE